MSLEDEIAAAAPDIRRQLGGRIRDPELLEDVVQDAMEKAIRAKDRFERGTNLKGWLYTIARNAWLSRLRKIRREVLAPPEDVTRAADRAQGVADGAWSGDVLAALAAIGPDQRDAVVAVLHLGMSYAQAATALRTAPGTVKSRVSRGRDALATTLRDGAIAGDDVLTALGGAVRGVPRSDPYHPVAEALGALYGRHGGVEAVDEEEAAWRELVASGALDYETEELE